MQKAFKICRNRNTILVLVVLALGLLSIQTIGDLDTGFHLATGKYIATHLSVPLYDVFSYTAQGTRLVAHYWLSDITFFGVYELVGYRGLMIFAALIALAAFLCTYVSGKKFLDASITPIALLVLNFFTLELWVIRPQIISYLFTSLLICLLVLFQRTKKREWLYCVIALMFVWGNAHAGVMLGAVLIAWFGGIYVFANKNEIKKHAISIGLFLAAIGVTLINPNGYKTLIYSQIISESVEKMHIAEWKSLLFYLGQTWQSVAFLSLMVLCVILFFARIKNIKKMHGLYETTWLFGLLVIGCALPLFSIRHVGLFPFLGYLPTIAALHTIKYESEKIKKIIKVAVVAFLIFLCGYGIYRYTNLLTINHHILPSRGAQFVKEQNVSGNIFNTQPVGGWLIWELWPQRNVYYDGRSELYMGAMDDELRGIVSGEADWEKIFEKRNISYVIMHYRESMTNAPSVAAAALFKKFIEEGKFKLVFWDDAALVLIKNSGPNKKIAEKFGYEHISPFFVKEGNVQDIMREFNRALQASPDSISIQLTARDIISKIEQ